LAHQADIERQVAIVFIALIALLIPVAGPSVDHHFFERFASHSHVYLGDPDLDHGHVVDVDFDSSNSVESSYVATSGDGPSTGSVSFFAADTVDSDFAIELADGVLSRSVAEFERPPGIVIAAPEEPPRTDSPLKYMESVGRFGIG
jgi:hypothetical protein